jgi:hypothetical protein
MPATSQQLAFLLEDLEGASKTGVVVVDLENPH